MSKQNIELCLILLLHMIWILIVLRLLFYNAINKMLSRLLPTYFHKHAELMEIDYYNLHATTIQPPRWLCYRMLLHSCKLQISFAKIHTSTISDWSTLSLNERVRIWVYIIMGESIIGSLSLCHNPNLCIRSCTLKLIVISIQFFQKSGFSLNMHP